MSDTTEIELPETMHVEGELLPDENRKLSPREQVMQDISRRAEEARQREMQQASIYDQDARAAGLALPEDEQDPPPGAVEQVAQEPAPAPAQDAPAPVPAAAPVAPALRVVEMDGQTVAVTEEQYQQLARLGMVAQAALSRYQPEPVASAPAQPIVDPERVRDVAKRLQYGNEDEAAAALTQFVTDVVSRVPQGPAIDPNAIIQRATQAAVQQATQQAQLQRDTETIRQEFADIFENEQRTLLARMNVEAIRARNAAQGRYQPDIEIYREAGNMVRGAMGRPRPGNDAPSPAIQAAPRTEVLERKRSAPRMTQAIDRRAPSPEPQRPPSGSEIVERMRAQRGQASMR